MVRIKKKTKIDQTGRYVRYSAVALAAVTLVFCAVFTGRAWVEPGVSPPGGNVAAPLHTGTTSQSKQGSLAVYGAGGYGIYAQGPNYGAYGYETDTGSYGILGYSGYGGYFNGPTYTNSYSYSTVMYDTNDGNYYSDPNSTSRLNYTVNNNVYSYGWIYSGAYLQAPTICIGGDCRSGWPSSSDTLQTVTDRGSSTNHWLYFPGFSDTDNGGYYLDPNGTSRLNYGVFDNVYSYSWMQAPIFYDANDSGYYLDPNNTSRLNYGVFNNIYAYGGIQAPTMYASALYDLDNKGYYLDPNGNSSLHFVSANYLHTNVNDSWFPYYNGWNYFRGPAQAFNGTWYDENNNGYYLDPSNTSRFNYGVFDNVYSYGWMQAPIFYDSNDNGYYLDPNGTSRLNYAVINNVYNYGEVSSDVVRARSQLCIGNDCRTAWPSSGPVSTGLYGSCQDQGPNAGQCSGATAPAFCYLPPGSDDYQCGCPGGYTRVATGSNGAEGGFYSCQKQ